MNLIIPRTESAKPTLSHSCKIWWFITTLLLQMSPYKLYIIATCHDACMDVAYDTVTTFS